MELSEVLPHFIRIQLFVIFPFVICLPPSTNTHSKYTFLFILQWILFLRAHSYHSISSIHFLFQVFLVWYVPCSASKRKRWKNSLPPHSRNWMNLTLFTMSHVWVWCNEQCISFLLLLKAILMISIIIAQMLLLLSSWLVVLNYIAREKYIKWRMAIERNVKCAANEEKCAKINVWIKIA